jgi:hypothetical protein
MNMKIVSYFVVDTVQLRLSSDLGQFPSFISSVYHYFITIISSVYHYFITTVPILYSFGLPLLASAKLC